ncbi:HAD family hydrolase [Ligilactobacillus ceti]|uniref:HAD-superfamily hydrolase phosphatase n=1 Tax=Ligilactobacillus ceti DSM 22408 TaxID=1122146 RepID=A0A0R2KQ20_9LACO|nr:HAD family hydrolase [Ligilactobacillus ceti]KRN89653.1 HAD-superfamily hydrolase phosphatase [Ligilactobacillus ceti DSM 22408]
MVKHIFLDVDGTLCDYQHQVPESAKTAIKLTRAKGNQVYLCTGRSAKQIGPDLMSLGIDGVVGGDGSYVEYENKIIVHHPLQLMAVQQIIAWLNAHDLTFCLETNQGVFAHPDFAHKAQPAFQKYFHGDQKTDQQVVVTDLFHDLTFTTDLERDDVNRLTFILSEQADFQQARQKFPDLLVESWGGKAKDPLFASFGVFGVNKAHGAQELVEYLNIDPKTTIAVGDGRNDLDLFSYVDQAIAMGNSNPEVKERADYITADVTDDGLYQAFEKYNLI